MSIFTGVLWIIGTCLIPETYAPVLLRARAKELSKRTGKNYQTRTDIDQGKQSVANVYKIALSRPWILLFREPIVLFVSIYMSIIYGTLYMLFGAFPIVYQQKRGWSPGIGGLAFLGVMVGMIFAVAYALWENKRYVKVSDKNNGFAPPETRLPMAMLGGVMVTIGLFWFAWTNYPSIPWIVSTDVECDARMDWLTSSQVSILAGIPFGFGMVLVFLALMNYLIDAYTIYAAVSCPSMFSFKQTPNTILSLFSPQVHSYDRSSAPPSHFSPHKCTTILVFIGHQLYPDFSHWLVCHSHSYFTSMALPFDHAASMRPRLQSSSLAFKRRTQARTRAREVSTGKAATGRVSGIQMSQRTRTLNELSIHLEYL